MFSCHYAFPKLYRKCVSVWEMKIQEVHSYRVAWTLPPSAATLGFAALSPVSCQCVDYLGDMVGSNRSNLAKDGWTKGMIMKVATAMSMLIA